MNHTILEVPPPKPGAVDWQEMLAVPALRVGVYRLAVGACDPQSPHAEDEVYYVLSGRATFFADGERRLVMAGNTIYVAAGIEHRFENIEEALTLIVFFGAKESAQQ